MGNNTTVLILNDAFGDIQSYETWARKNDKKCRRFSHYDSNQRVFRITNRPSLLRDDGFVLSAGIATVNKDFPTALSAVQNLVEGMGYSTVVYYLDRLSNEVLIWVN